MGLESGRPNPSVRGGRGVCHPPLWAPSSWKREKGDRGWWSCVASGSGSSSCRERWGQEPCCSSGESLLLQPKLQLHQPSMDWMEEQGINSEYDFASVDDRLHPRRRRRAEKSDVGFFS